MTDIQDENYDLPLHDQPSRISTATGTRERPIYRLHMQTGDVTGLELRAFIHGLERLIRDMRSLLPGIAICASGRGLRGLRGFAAARGVDGRYAHRPSQKLGWWWDGLMREGLKDAGLASWQSHEAVGASLRRRGGWVLETLPETQNPHIWRRRRDIPWPPGR